MDEQTTHPDPDRLIRVPLFADLSDEDRARVASWLEVDEHRAGTHLVREGTSDYVFFILDQGEARVEHEGRAIGRLSAGDVFGEMAIIGDGHRRAEVVADSDVRVFSMFGTHFRQMESTMPGVASKLQALVAERERLLDAPPET
jgi:CRP-like cAMP-binding protein